MTPCPACLSLATDEVVRLHSIAEATEHFIPMARSPSRHRQLADVLQRLWPGADSVEIHRCRRCGFGFPIPYVAGDMEFYNLVSGGDPHYPANRWEFRQTIAILEQMPNTGPITLLEAGAGEGRFLEALLRTAGRRRFRVSAIEYDHAAIAKLHKRGFEARAGSLTDIGTSERFDVICLFQTLEHMVDLDRTFRTIRDALRPAGHAFISVPHGPAVDQQEQAVGLWDMPPNHVGRWTQLAFHIIAERHGLELRDIVVEPLNRIAELTRLSVYQVNSRAYRDDTWAHIANAIAFRPLRVLLKGTMAAAWMPTLAWRVRPLLSHSVWVHLHRPTDVV